MATPKKTATRKPKAVEAGMVEVECTCDRLPLENGEVLANGAKAIVPLAHAEVYAATGRARRV